MCLQCVFSSFSTDSGCTVELVDSSTTLVHYSTVFNRSTNIAEGCITDVNSGQYDIRVYIKGSLWNYWIRNVSVYPNSHSVSIGGLHTVSGTALASPSMCYIKCCDLLYLLLITLMIDGSQNALANSLGGKPSLNIIIIVFSC